MIILGINETSHDASVSLIKDGEILFAAHAERYSKQKNDWYNNKEIYLDALNYGTPTHIAYYEKPLLKKSRLMLKGGASDWLPNIPMDLPVKYFSHHYSHACAGYYTSKYNEAAIVVLDAIGEWNTSTVWIGEGENIRLKYKQNYPVSFGLFYSAFTQLIGLKPNQEEYIMMGMVAYGNSKKYYKKVDEYYPKHNKQKYNFHKGIIDWNAEITEQDRFDIAAAVQLVYEQRLNEFMHMAYTLTGKKNLVFMGGCALNSSANTMLWNIFDSVWIMPNPGDAGSSLGAAAALYGKHINWKTPYLGHELSGKYPVEEIVDKIFKDGIAAVAIGRAEYGPRALGNRSILADPRDPAIKDKVNAIKQREPFRPFAPVVMAEFASQWFDMDFESPYMQYTVKCLQPEKVPSIVHADGTSRVQTVTREQNPGLYSVVNRFYLQTGIPMLLNTSLNIKGQPLLNDISDVEMWEKEYNFKIFTGSYKTITVNSPAGTGNVFCQNMLANNFNLTLRWVNHNRSKFDKNGINFYILRNPYDAICSAIEMEFLDENNTQSKLNLSIHIENLMIAHKTEYEKFLKDSQEFDYITTIDFDFLTNNTEEFLKIVSERFNIPFHGPLMTGEEVKSKMKLNDSTILRLPREKTDLRKHIDIIVNKNPSLDDLYKKYLEYKDDIQLNFGGMK